MALEGKTKEHSKYLLIFDLILYIVCLLRGKESGHDVDLLVTHPKLGEEQGILEKIIKELGIT